MNDNNPPQEPIYSLAVLVHDKDHPNAIIENLHKMSADEFEKFNKASERLTLWLKADMESFSILEYSYHQFKETVKEVSEQLVSPTLPLINDELVAINASFFSFLSLMRLYLDYTAKKIGSKNKAELEAFNKATNVEFDGYFSYRFFCQLRNYAQHLAMPIKGLNASNSLDETGTKVIIKFRLYFIRDELLVHDDNWTHKVLPDLKTQPKHIDVLPLVKEVMDSLYRIHKTTVNAYLPLLKDDIDLVKGLMKHGEGRKQKPFVARLSDFSSGQKANVNMKELPTGLIEYADRISAS